MRTTMPKARTFPLSPSLSASRAVNDADELAIFGQSKHTIRSPYAVGTPEPEEAFCCAPRHDDNRVSPDRSGGRLMNRSRSCRSPAVGHTAPAPASVVGIFTRVTPRLLEACTGSQQLAVSLADGCMTLDRFPASKRAHTSSDYCAAETAIFQIDRLRKAGCRLAERLSGAFSRRNGRNEGGCSSNDHGNRTSIP